MFKEGIQINIEVKVYTFDFNMIGALQSTSIFMISLPKGNQSFGQQRSHLHTKV